MEEGQQYPMDAQVLQEKLKSLDSEIEERKSALLANVTRRCRDAFASSPQEYETDWLPKQLLETFWLLKNGFEETDTLIQRDDLAGSQHSFEVLSIKAAEFGEAYPNTLLSLDINRKLGQLRDRLDDLYSSEWQKYVKCEPSKLSITDPEVAEVVLKACPDLTRSFVQHWFAQNIIEPLLALKIILKYEGTGAELNWESREIKSIDELISSVKSLVEFCVGLPQPLVSRIPSAWGPHLVSELIRSSIPKLYPDDANPTEFKRSLTALSDLEPLLRKHGWSHTNEVSRFVGGFDGHWQGVRQEKYLMKLRHLYQEVVPITESNRSAFVAEYQDNTEPEEVDEWEWNDDEDNEPAVAAEAAGGATNSSGSKGRTVDLWISYSEELGTYTPEPYFTLYRALVPAAYEYNYIWIYADTLSFITHIQHRGGHPDIDQLSQFLDDNLHKYVRGYMEQLDNELLPQLFGSHSASALDAIKAMIDEIALATNEAGGPTLRQSVLSQLFEQMAVYVIETVEEKSDIGESESQHLATIITKLGFLAVYLEDVNATVPSWTKLEILKEILSSSLASIDDLHERGLLADYNGVELEGLVKALFVESSARAALIRKL